MKLSKQKKERGNDTSFIRETAKKGATMPETKGRKRTSEKDFIFSCVPEEAIEIAQQKFPKQEEKVIDRLLVVYHQKYNPRDHYIKREELTKEETQRLVKIIQQRKEIPGLGPEHNKCRVAKEKLMK